MPRGGSSECGSPWAGRRHQREGTEPCPGDREALRAYMRAFRAERKRRATEKAAEVTRQAQARAVRERAEAPVLAAHEAGELVLG